MREIISQKNFIEKFKDVEEMRKYVSNLHKKGYLLFHPSNIEEEPWQYAPEPYVTTPSKKDYLVEGLVSSLKNIDLVSCDKEQIEMVNAYRLFLVEDYLFSQEYEFDSEIDN